MIFAFWGDFSQVGSYGFVRKLIFMLVFAFSGSRNESKAHGG